MTEVGLSSEALDPQTDPCSDFYQFACGGWLASTPIPEDKSRWMRSFNEIHRANETELRKIVESAADASDPTHRKIGAFYGACMDEEKLEGAGLQPIQPLLDGIGRVRSAKTLGEAITTLHRHRVWAVFDIDDAQDFKDATRVIAMLDQNGLGLPDRDYYATGDQELDRKKPADLTEAEKKQIEKSKNIRAEYESHVERMLGLAGFDSTRAQRAADHVMEIETALAKLSKTRVERRDPDGLYNKIDLAGVKKAAPRFPWASYFEGLGFPEISDINVTSVEFFEGLDRLMVSTPSNKWRDYLTWHTVRSLAPSLGKKFVEEDFRLVRVLTGQPEQRPRWKRCIEATDRTLGELLAQPFIARKFAGDSKTAAERMVHEISRAFRKEVDSLDWMDAGTRTRALAKLDTLAYLIGYPPKWKAYDWEVGSAHASNVLASRAYELKRELTKIGKPVDRAEWLMSPPTVNAYYHPLKNHMVFPAGILQPPFYSVDAAVPVNLGAMGMVVGHELTHGFDDQGSKFDADGNLKNWWGPEVRARFDERTRCVEEQYSSYEPLPGVKLNGKLTLGENIADLGGIKLAFRAYRAMREGAEPVLARAPEDLAPFTEDQQFFLGTAQAWCGKYRDEEHRLRAKTDPHSAAQFRVNGPLSNLPEFAEAFGCSANAPMVRKNRCEVW